VPQCAGSLVPCAPVFFLVHRCVCGRDADASLCALFARCGCAFSRRLDDLCFVSRFGALLSRWPVFAGGFPGRCACCRASCLWLLEPLSVDLVAGAPEILVLPCMLWRRAARGPWLCLWSRSAGTINPGWLSSLGDRLSIQYGCVRWLSLSGLSPGGGLMRVYPLWVVRFGVF